MRQVIVRSLLVLAIPFAAACASAGAGGSTYGGSRDLITAEEIAAEARPGMSAYELVQNLRPTMLRTRGSSSARAADAGFGAGGEAGAVVYLDGVRMGGVAELRRISGDLVESVRYLSGTEATTAYGTGHGAGAILVTTKTGG